MSLRATAGTASNPAREEPGGAGTCGNLSAEAPPANIRTICAPATLTRLVSPPPVTASDFLPHRLNHRSVES